MPAAQATELTWAGGTRTPIAPSNDGSGWKPSRRKHARASAATVAPSPPRQVPAEGGAVDHLVVERGQREEDRPVEAAEDHRATLAQRADVG
jgi:hypothetical protein